MKEKEKKWVPVFFPMGPFAGTVNIAIKGEHIMTAEEAKAVIDTTEKENVFRDKSTVTLCDSGSPSSEGETKV